MTKITRTSQRGVDLIKRFEGLEQHAYKCPAGVWTIGYGHTAGFRNKTFGPDSVITEKEAEELLKRDLRFREAAVAKYVTVPLRQNQFDALVSLVYNIGVGNFTRSTVLKRLNKGDYYGAGKAFLMWRKITNPKTGQLEPSEGLLRRRRAERQMFDETPREPLPELA